MFRFFSGIGLILHELIIAERIWIMFFRKRFRINISVCCILAKQDILVLSILIWNTRFLLFRNRIHVLLCMYRAWDYQIKVSILFTPKQIIFTTKTSQNVYMEPYFWITTTTTSQRHSPLAYQCIICILPTNNTKRRMSIQLLDVSNGLTTVCQPNHITVLYLTYQRY